MKSPPELMTLIASVDDPAYLADKVVGHLCIQFPEPSRVRKNQFLYEKSFRTLR